MRQTVEAITAACDGGCHRTNERYDIRCCYINPVSLASKTVHEFGVLKTHTVSPHGPLSIKGQMENFPYKPCELTDVPSVA